MADDTLVVSGYRELLRACDRAGKESKKEVRNALRAVAEPVRLEAVQLFSPIDVRSAANYRVVVRQRGVAVEQRLRKTTGKHPEYGALQMRKALIPALNANVAVVDREMERAIDRIARNFER